MNEIIHYLRGKWYLPLIRTRATRILTSSRYGAEIAQGQSRISSKDYKNHMERFEKLRQRSSH